MATAARLAAALSVGIASTLVLLSSPGGSGLIGLIGWVSVALLAAGLIMGHRGGIVALSVGMILRLSLLGAMGEVIQPDLWVQVVLLTLAIETAAVSFTLRIRPVDPLVVMLRSIGMALIAAGLVETMDVLVVGTDSSGTLVRVAGVAALVLVAGWVIRTWRRTGLIG